MIKNLVFGLAINYELEKIVPFILSLRKYYDGQIAFVINNANQQVIDFLKENNVHLIQTKEQIDARTIGFKRWGFYKEIIESEFSGIENVLLADIRDVVFQANPFEYFSGAGLDFSCEPKRIGECAEHNALWIKSIYGDEALEKVKNNWTLCAGVVGGKRGAVVNLCEVILNEAKELEKIGKLSFTDQASLNVLYGNGIFPDSFLHQNGGALVSTMHHSTALTFNRRGMLLGDNGKPIAMVHQYDRCGALSVAFLKNAMNLSGKQGILMSSQYAVNNFYEHDL